MRRSFALALVLLAACSTAPKGPGTASKSSAGTSLGNIHGGTAQLVLSGGYSAKVGMALDTKRSQLHAPPGGFAVFWSSAGNLLSIGGVTFTGSKKTFPGLVVGFLWTKGTVVVSKTSSRGECTIKMRSTPTSISGSFTCPKLSENGKQYSASGSFVAAA